MHQHTEKLNTHLLDGRLFTLLPLWRCVVFVDWSGVLSRETFWSSILGNSRHPLYKPMRLATKTLFENRVETLRAWMRGRLTSEEIVTQLDVQLNRRYKSDYLLRRLHEDCRRMTCDPDLVNELRVVRTNAFVVLATDNMDCFWRAVLAIRGLSLTVDAILCSSELGVLKKDSVDRFFRPWLARHNLTFQNSLLLDDSEDICEAFQAAGGAAVVVGSSEDAILGLRTWGTRRT